MKEIRIPSSLDGSLEPALFHEAAGTKRPLLVGLHTWSHDRFNQVENMLPLAEKHGFHLLLPEFRGPNLRTNPRCTMACGSEYAVEDVKDAIDFVREHCDVDEENIFLLGLSGGGHMALMMAGRCPEYFRAIGAFVPICDLSKWAIQNPDYRENLLACCGVDRAEQKKRSPVSYAETIARANLKIFHGKFDPVVPVSQSMELYELVAEADPAARVFLDIFDGGHEIDMAAAEHWILSQYEKRALTAVTG